MVPVGAPCSSSTHGAALPSTNNYEILSEASCLEKAKHCVMPPAALQKGSSRPRKDATRHAPDTRLRHLCVWTLKRRDDELANIVDRLFNTLIWIHWSCALSYGQRRLQSYYQMLRNLIQQFTYHGEMQQWNAHWFATSQRIECTGNSLMHQLSQIMFLPGKHSAHKTEPISTHRI